VPKRPWTNDLCAFSYWSKERVFWGPCGEILPERREHKSWRGTFVFKSHCSAPIFEFLIWLARLQHGVIDGWPVRRSRGVGVPHTDVSRTRFPVMDGQLDFLNLSLRTTVRRTAPIPTRNGRPVLQTGHLVQFLCIAISSISNLITFITSTGTPEGWSTSQKHFHPNLMHFNSYHFFDFGRSSRRVTNWLLAKNIFFTPISTILNLITFSTSAGPTEGSPGWVLAKKTFSLQSHPFQIWSLFRPRPVLQQRVSCVLDGHMIRMSIRGKSQAGKGRILFDSNMNKVMENLNLTDERYSLREESTYM